MKKRKAPVLALAALWSGQALSQSATAVSDTELSKEIENPVTRRITLPLRYEEDFNDGAYKATKDTFSIGPLRRVAAICIEYGNGTARGPLADVPARARIRVRDGL